MKLAGRVVVVTGGASGIGRALSRRFRAEGARVVVADLDADGAKSVAHEIGGLGLHCDVSKEAAIRQLVSETEVRVGTIDLFCSNAGIATFDPDPDLAGSASNANWSRSWGVNVMAHVYAARALVPGMIARRGGYFLQTISAAGLLSQVGGAVYATTKHAAVGFAEVLAITHRDHGIKVSILCPQGVDTPMLQSLPAGPQTLDGVLSPDAVADAAVAGIERESFLILPHPQVLTYLRNKSQDYDRWIGGMAKLRRKLNATDRV